MLSKLRDPATVQFFEHIHIPLWLLKDIFWLLSFKTAGVVMAIPTILVAMLMVLITARNKSQFLPNVSILFWILANANWMFDEFFELGIKHYSLYPFLAGILVFVIFVLQKLMAFRKAHRL